MSRLYDNIRSLCKQNGVKISQIEAPKKAGFISRYEKRGAIMELPLQMVYQIAKECHVSIEDLIEKDFTTTLKLAEVRSEIKRLKAEEAELSNALTEMSPEETKAMVHEIFGVK